MSVDPQTFADPKVIGTDIEDLVVDAVDCLEANPDEDDHFDAVVDGVLWPRTLEAGFPVIWAGIPLVEDGTQIEIKACVQERSNGTRDSPGAWCFKGRDDGQHASLLDSAAMYALALYRDASSARELLAIVVIPASILDEHLRGRWFDVDRREGTCAQLSWPTLIDEVVLEGGEQ